MGRDIPTNKEIRFDADTGLVPAIIQDVSTGKVLMLGYMNQNSLDQTIQSGKVTFWSRSKKRLWMKGETSGNFLTYLSHRIDCDGDALLIKANPAGPVCHTGTDTCWEDENQSQANSFLNQLQEVIDQRYNEPSDESYTSRLFQKGINKMAQKVGEEATELVIEAKDDNDTLLLGEAADLLYHVMVLLRAKGKSLADVVGVLETRHSK